MEKLIHQQKDPDFDPVRSKEGFTMGNKTFSKDRDDNTIITSTYDNPDGTTSKTVSPFSSLSKSEIFEYSRAKQKQQAINFSKTEPSLKFKQQTKDAGYSWHP